MGADNYVSVLLYPCGERSAMGFKDEAQVVQVPTSGDASRQMHVSGLLKAISKQHPAFASHVDTCHLARGAERGATELLARDARLFPFDQVSIHLIPKAPEQLPPTGAKRHNPTQLDRMSQPLVQTLCEYTAPAEVWPAPLPPTSVLLAERGFAHDHAHSKLLLTGTKSFWVIPGCILAGPAPTDSRTVRLILETGVRAFVDLRAPHEGKSYEEMVRYQYADMVATEVCADIPTHAPPASSL